MGEPTTDATTLRERALAALREQEAVAAAELEESGRVQRERDLEWLRRDLAAYLGIDASEATIEWGPWGYDDREIPRIVIDGIRFQRNESGVSGRIVAIVKRDDCGHEERGYISGPGSTAWGHLGRAVRSAMQVECRRCADPDILTEKVVEAPAPTTGERLDALVREIVRDELWRREEA